MGCTLGMPFPTASSIARCPLCDAAVSRDAIRPGPFDCPHCAKQIQPSHRPGYLWLRGALCVALAVAVAKLRRFDWSLLIFVVSLYAIPAFLFWDAIAFKLFPPKRFEPVKPLVETLRIGHS